MSDTPETIPATRACVLACSGSSAAGELADHTARRLQQLGVANMSCLAGIGGRIPSILATARNAGDLLVIDGCLLECGANVLRHTGFAGFKHLKLHELGVRKNDPAMINERTVAQLAAAAARVLNKPLEAESS